MPKYHSASPRFTKNQQASAKQIFIFNYFLQVEVWLKGGFLRSDSLLGTAQIKIQTLETSCDLHDSFALMDGRKAVGGQVIMTSCKTINLRPPSKFIDRVPYFTNIHFSLKLQIWQLLWFLDTLSPFCCGPCDIPFPYPKTFVNK